MPFFESKDRTVYSPVNPVLELLYEFLEKHQKNLSGSNFFDELLDNYEYMDQMLKERNEEV
ncbi:hypothetical protein [Niallia sp. 03091]|uniref:hypothetical protein n=1 Tax=Niallia sp. 03091 TaxID=3458059 RepID=UPI0040448688